jgi:hypothetical protein
MSNANRSRGSLSAVLVVLAAACSSPLETTDQPGTPGGGQPDGSGPQPVTDAGLFAHATASTPWTWYKLSADTLSPTSDSPHFARLRTRYNSVAATSLDGTGRVTAGTIFSDGALIVKEIYKDGALAALAVMAKAPGDPNAGHGAWLWAEYSPGGGVLHSLTQSEETCHACHLPGLDHTRMNDAHP